MNALDILNRYFNRHWVCQVVRSGYHNGAGCDPQDPFHDNTWGCGYRIEASLTDAQFEALKENLS